jgi:hypothetical protein
MAESLLLDLSPGIDNDVGANDDLRAGAGGSTRGSASTAAFSFSVGEILLMALGLTPLL